MVLADNSLYGGRGSNILSDVSASAEFFDFIAIDVNVFCLFALRHLFVSMLCLINTNDNGLFSRLIHQCDFDLLIVFGLYYSVGLLIILSFLFLHRHEFFDILFDLLQNCKLRILDGAHILLDLCLLAFNIYNDLMSWFGKNNTGNYDI